MGLLRDIQQFYQIGEMVYVLIFVIKIVRDVRVGISTDKRVIIGLGGECDCGEGDIGVRG